MLAAAALSVLGIVAFWWLGDVGDERERECDAREEEEKEEEEEEDGATLRVVESESGGGGGGGGGGELGCGDARRRMQLGVLFLGAATRLLLGVLGTAAMVRVVGDRTVLKRGSFIAVEVLGWLLV